MESALYQKLLNYAFWLLGRKSYTEAEILKKLKLRILKLSKAASGPSDEAVIAQVLTRLKELNYISDEKILADYFEYRLKVRPIGKFKFLHEMHGRGIPFERAKAAWEKQGIDEMPIALEVLGKKARLWGKLPPVLRKKKAAQFLASRGFAPDTVWGVIEKM